jgi:hypothetical protein
MEKEKLKIGVDKLLLFGSLYLRVFWKTTVYPGKLVDFDKGSYGNISCDNR